MNRLTLPLLAAACSTALAACGIITAPISLPAAVAENRTFTIHGPIVDQDGRSLEGVIVKVHNIHHLWTPVAGSKDVNDELLRRQDGQYEFVVRGSAMDVTFSKDGYYDTWLHFDADAPEIVRVKDAEWTMSDRFPAVLLSQRPGDAALRKLDRNISYANYPVAECVALPNLATEARNGDVVYAGKDAEDATVFPPGTLYLTLSKEAPPPINAKGDIDPEDLDVPHHVTLHLPGAKSGLIPIKPRPGFDPMATADEAPADGYSHELTISRARLKAMRKADSARLTESREYFYFRAGDSYGKGEFSWGARSGPPAFQYRLYMQPYAGMRDLTTHRPGS